tara:strand:- start:407 stop:616 length:210 start_codon:yes stop_codon:yes gene_type:complete
MNNYDNEMDKLRFYLEELTRKHRNLDIEIETLYNNITITDEVRRMKTMKLYLKDEIHRINAQLIQLGLQ